MTERVLEAGRRLKVVGRAGVGVDNIDVPAATRLGVLVVNAPRGNIIAAAEHSSKSLHPRKKSKGRKRKSRRR